ncbi:hypothetical protein WR25_02598 [Diploscapter pachys]|uniref:TOG domain-containing protein n=1 Tax=Diploscapter pachys TaxID=2018661 RepID=A0A2A2LA58_9BILA|nr:hypothetical protein WR25_02598 [Diploscapter pachys]
MRGAKFDSVGRMLKEAVDEWEMRSGVGTALGYLAEQVEAPMAEKLVKIVVPRGIIDRHVECRTLMTEAAVETIKRHGTAILYNILPFLESLQEKTSSDAKDDNMRQGLVVLLGTLARYIPNQEKIESIVFRLVGTLSTPSQPVQESVCQCLAPLAKLLNEKTAKEIIVNLMGVLLEGKSYAERRGAAYGIGGFIKGLGTLAMKDYDMLTIIEKNLSDKSSPVHRQGGLLALEILCSSIGRLFEPYIIYVLPSLLNCFSDSDEKVRENAHMTANAMMASLSTYGTRLVLPNLLEMLDNDSWRAKCSATELLGSVAHMAPQQLSASLPSIVPKLIEVLADSSAKVQRSGEKAMQQIADVVRNPEIIGITKQLMAGLIDPVNKTNYSLQAVLNTKFIHYIDSPSLALLMPVVRRAFEDRNSDTRRIAAQIIANIYSLTDPMDTEPYLNTLVPGIQKSLLDPVPEIRAVSARALGAIIAKSSPQVTQHLQQKIIPWLKEKLICPQSTVDRSGAAQGLCEVLAGCGKEQLDYVMPEIITATESTEVSPETRDGYILMYIYLPMTFKDQFIPYLPKVVPPILKALADENEYVRASALKAGQRLIMQYMLHAKKLLLPELQSALMDDNWRIRHAAVTLIGDFLFNITGVTGKSTTATADDDDTMGMEQAGKVIVRALGQATRDKVVAGLYLARSDVALVVRQAASHVWKIVVSNTPRTLREIIKDLFGMIVDSLVSSCEERQQSGARCLGELVKKMGDKVINEILPILEVNQQSEDPAKRIGVAVALYEIIANMSKDVLNHYLPQLVPAIRCSISDEDEDVREAAADTFSKLYLSVGHEALDSIIMPLLERLTPDEDYVLDGLCEVMKQNSKSMLPYLLPKLTKPPVNVHALCKLASVAGDSLARQLPKVLDALLASSKENSEDDPMIEPCEEVVLSVTDDDGVPVLIEYLIKKAHAKNIPAIVLLQKYIEKCPTDLTDFVVELLPGLLALYGGQYEPASVDHAVLAAIALTQKVDMRDAAWDVLHPMKKAINMLISQAKGRVIPGFQHPKGLNPLMGILRDTILSGGPELKQLAGETLSSIIVQASDTALVPHIVNVTGTLIRVIGDRFPPDVKLSLLECLSRMLDKVDDKMKPFLAPMQTTFLKAIQEQTSRPVRLAAGGALSRLAKNIQQKPEPIVTEMLKILASTSSDQYLLESTFVSARAIVRYCAEKLQQSTIEEGYRVCALIYETYIENMSDLDRSLTSVSGALLGELVVRTKQFEKQSHIFKDLESQSTPIRTKQAKAVALQQMCQSDSETVWKEMNDACRSALNTAFNDKDPVIAQAAIRAAAYILISNGNDPDRDLLTAMIRSINHPSVDVRKTAAMSMGHICHRVKEPFTLEQLKLIIPQLINGTRESNSAVRSASELALVHAFQFAKNTDIYDVRRFFLASKIL